MFAQVRNNVLNISQIYKNKVRYKASTALRKYVINTEKQIKK